VDVAAKVQRSGVFILRCTRKVIERMATSVIEEQDLPKPSAVLGEWTANLVMVGRQQIVLAANHATLLPVVLPGAPYRTLVPRFADAVARLLTRLEVDPAKIDVELSALSEAVVARTNDRRVLGSLNDFDRMLGVDIMHRSLTEAAYQLSKAPCGPLDMASPCDVARARFGRPHLRLVKG
jgi:hypothetical protein